MIRIVCLALILVLTGHVGSALAFTAADFKGWYAFGFEGLEDGKRIVSTGVMRLDGIGAVTGRASLLRDEGGGCNGTIRNSTYSVNPDGTGLFQLGFFADAPCNTSMVIALNTAARSVQEFEFSSGQGTFSGRATRRGAGPHNTAELVGTYAFRLAGVDGFTPTVASGVMTLDGSGTVTGRATFKKESGGAISGDIRNSTYGVNADGTGFMALGFFPDIGFGLEALPLSIAVFASGRGFEFASNANALYAGTAWLQVPPAP